MKCHDAHNDESWCDEGGRGCYTMIVFQRNGKVLENCALIMEWWVHLFLEKNRAERPELKCTLLVVMHVAVFGKKS